MSEVHKVSLELGGRTLSLETGKLAEQADASVLAQYGETVVLATVVMSQNERDGIDFFPLMVEYEERLYAAGKIKGSRFIKREGRPPDEAILTSRLIDRAIRPLFDERLRRDVQVVCTALSWDQENDPDVLALVAASAALSISSIPWAGPLGALRIGRIPSDEDSAKAEWALNTTYAARAKSQLDLVVAGTDEKVVMLEAGAQEVSEEVTGEALTFALKHMKGITKLIEELKEKAGKPKVPVAPHEITDEAERKTAEEKAALVAQVQKWLEQKVPEVMYGGAKHTKTSRHAALGQLQEELEEYLVSEQIGKDKRKDIFTFFKKYVEREITRKILDEDKRVDGRKLTDIRPLTSEVSVLPRTHGSGLFQRGETQVLSTVTLGSPGMEQTLDSMEETGKKRYMHHYNFPPYSVGEAKPMRGPGRREIGHGALAERALLPVIPSDKLSFPYTIRVVSEVLGSNGSSSMASTCGSTLALMDAGVPIKKPVAGIAMGLASDEKGNYKILTDLQDLEDGPGGMDFKIAGTRDGITAIQMDTKTKGLTLQICKETLAQAKIARLQILDVIESVIAAPRAEMSPHAPRIYTLMIKPDSIRNVIGPGGKMINEIIAVTGVQIDIEDDGTVMVTAPNPDSADKALNWIKQLTHEVAAGERYEGKVTRIMDFGAFVEVLPKQEGLVHISELAPFRVGSVTDVVQEGDIIPVVVREIDAMGRINLSLKDADPEYAARKGVTPGAGGDAPHHGGFGGRPRGGNGGGRGGGFGGRSRRF